MTVPDLPHGKITQNGDLIAEETKHGSMRIWIVQRGGQPLGRINERGPGVLEVSASNGWFRVAQHTSLADAMRALGDLLPSASPALPEPPAPTWYRCKVCGFQLAKFSEYAPVDGGLCPNRTPGSHDAYWEPAPALPVEPCDHGVGRSCDECRGPAALLVEGDSDPPFADQAKP